MELLKQLLPDKFENLGVFILIILVTFLIEFVVRKALNRFIMVNSVAMKNDPTNYKFLANALRAIIFSVGLMFAIREYPPLQSVASSLLAGAGILAVAIGFASQQAFSNIISGVFIIIFKPFRVNDRLTVKDNYTGIVEDITLRHTIIRDVENRRIVVPNSVIASEILINADYADEKICKQIELGITYETNLDLAKKIMREEIENHPLFVDPRTEEDRQKQIPKAQIRVVQLTNSAVVLRGNAWAKDNMSAYEMQCDLLESLKKRFDAEGISFAYPHVVVLQK
jgi:small conductance mechanosensitive channel